MMKEYSLTPHPGMEAPICFSFDEASQAFTGPDGERVKTLAVQALEDGYIQLAHPPCTSYELPEQDRVTEAELGAILAMFWDTQDAFPSLAWTDDKHEAEGLLY